MQRTISRSGKYLTVRYRNNMTKSAAWDHLMANFPDGISNKENGQHPWRKSHSYGPEGMWGWFAPITKKKETMKIFFDTEFYEDGNTIDLMSIGLVREDGQKLYLINRDCDWTKPMADAWHLENTLPSLPPFGDPAWVSRKEMARMVHTFCSYKHLDYDGHASGICGVESMVPEFWAWYSAYDWVAICQLYGRMIDLPEDWPQYCNDFKQHVDRLGRETHDSNLHDALADAQWLHDEYYTVQMEQDVASAEVKDIIDNG